LGLPEVKKRVIPENVRNRAGINPNVPIIRPNPGITGSGNIGHFSLPNSETGG